MKLFNWKTEKLIYELECESWRELLESAVERKVSLSYANLVGANLEYANLVGANLEYANLRGADLRYADFRYADLRYADLRYADLRGAIGNLKELKSMQLETYTIAFTKDVLQIGCKNFSIEEWKNFTDKEIISFNGKDALNFWNKWKEHIFKTYELCFPKENKNE